MKKEMLGVMLDVSRNGVMKLDELKKFVGFLAAFGYNSVLLYMEDTYEIEDEPYFGYLRGGYTIAELKELDAYCVEIGIELIPCIQTLAHLERIFRWKRFQKIRDVDNILLISEEETYELIDKMFASVSQAFTSRKINIGMDEAHMVGLGKYLDKYGYRDRFSLFNEHLKRVLAIAEKYAFKPMMWSDMFFRLVNGDYYYAPTKDRFAQMTQEVADAVPTGVDLVYWDYYNYETKFVTNMLKQHMLFKNKTIFAGGAWTWKGFVPDNKFSLRMTLPAIAECKKSCVNNMFVTLWADDGKECSFYAVLPSLFRIAKEYYVNLDETVDEKQMAREFECLTGANYEDMLSLDDADYVDDAIEHQPVSKYMLYNDVFLGIYDSTVQGGEANYYRILAQKYAAMTKRNGEWNYLFSLQEKLCLILADKFCLGVKLRKAYQNGDFESLRKCLAVLKALPDKVQAFYKAVKEMWNKENKSFGFEVQQHRLGGLALRLNECAERLAAYLDGKIDKIEELEIELLDAAGGGKLHARQPMHTPGWSQLISPSKI